MNTTVTRKTRPPSTAEKPEGESKKNFGGSEDSITRWSHKRKGKRSKKLPGQFPKNNAQKGRKEKRYSAHKEKRKSYSNVNKKKESKKRPSGWKKRNAPTPDDLVCGVTKKRS